MASRLPLSRIPGPKYHLSLVALVVLATCGTEEKPPETSAATEVAATQRVTLQVDGKDVEALALPRKRIPTPLASHLPPGSWLRIEAASKTRRLEVELAAYPGYELRLYLGPEERLHLGHFRGSEVKPVQAVAGLESLALWSQREKPAPAPELVLKQGGKHRSIGLEELSQLSHEPWQGSGKKQGELAWSLTDVLQLSDISSLPNPVVLHSASGKREEQSTEGRKLLLKANSRGSFQLKAVDQEGKTVWRFRNLKRIDIN